MPRIEVDTESLTAGGAQQSAAGGQALEAASELRPRSPPPRRPSATAGRAARSAMGPTWSTSLAALGDATMRTGGNSAAAGGVYQRDRRGGNAALMAGGESYGGITVPEGDPGRARGQRGRLVATAGLLESVSGLLRGVLGGMSWFGPASAAHAGMTSSQSLMATTGAGR